MYSTCEKEVGEAGQVREQVSPLAVVPHNPFIQKKEYTPLILTGTPPVRPEPHGRFVEGRILPIDQEVRRQRADVFSRVCSVPIATTSAL